MLAEASMRGVKNGVREEDDSVPSFNFSPEIIFTLPKEEEPVPMGGLELGTSTGARGTTFG